MSVPNPGPQELPPSHYFQPGIPPPALRFPTEGLEDNDVLFPSFEPKSATLALLFKPPLADKEVEALIESRGPGPVLIGIVGGAIESRLLVG